MEKSFKEALKHRRTYYAITNHSPISDKEIEEIIDFAVHMYHRLLIHNPPVSYCYWAITIGNCGRSLKIHCGR